MRALMRGPLVLGLMACASTFAIPASAGERTSLGALPTLPAVKDADSPGKTLGVPGLTLKEKKTRFSSYYEISAATAQGYCLVDRDTALTLTSETTSTDVEELWRLTEKDGTATLERTRYTVASYLDNVWVKSKSSVELKALATDFGITAWGMRDTNGDVVVLAKRATAGIESSPHSVEAGGAGTMSLCTFGAVRVHAKDVKKGGGTAQLTGRLPAEGDGKTKVEPRFIVDISVVKVTRDPEPVVSVRFRKRGEDP